MRLVQPYQLGLVSCGFLGGALIVMLLPKSWRRPIVFHVSRGLIAGTGAGAILFAFFFIPFVGTFLTFGYSRIERQVWRLGIHPGPLLVLTVVFGILGVVGGLISGANEIKLAAKTRSVGANSEEATEFATH